MLHVTPRATFLAIAVLACGCSTGLSPASQSMTSSRTVIDTSKAPQPAAPIAQAVRSNGLIFLSGITPLDPGLQLVKGDFDAQFTQVMTNIGAVLEAGGSDFAHVLKCTVILARVEDWPRMNALYASYWPNGSFPARTAFQAPLPSPDFLVEVECVAEVPAR